MYSHQQDMFICFQPHNDGANQRTGRKIERAPGLVLKNSQRFRFTFHVLGAGEIDNRNVEREVLHDLNGFAFYDVKDRS